MRRYKQKMRKILQSSKGFTLIEMIVATALVAIFFTMAVAILPTWFQSYQDLITVSYARQIANGITKAVEGQVMFAADVKEVPGESGKIQGRGINGEFVIPEIGTDGQLLIEGLVYDPNFYRGMSAELKGSVVEGDYCTIVITITDEEGKQVFTKERSIQLVGKTP